MGGIESYVQGTCCGRIPPGTEVLFSGMPGKVIRQLDSGNYIIELASGERFPLPRRRFLVHISHPRKGVITKDGDR